MTSNVADMTHVIIWAALKRANAMTTTYFLFNTEDSNPPTTLTTLFLNLPNTDTKNPSNHYEIFYII